MAFGQQMIFCTIAVSESQYDGVKATEAAAKYGSAHKVTHQHFAELDRLVLQKYAVLHGFLFSRPSKKGDTQRDRAP